MTNPDPHDHGQPSHEQLQHGTAGQDTGHFDEAATTWDDDPAKLERARKSAALLRERLQLNGSERVLEIGAGTGQLSLNLADEVGSILVTDVSPGMVAAADRNIQAAGLADRLTATRLDLLTDPVPDPPFDGAWSQLAWHHVPDGAALLRRARAALTPGGWLAVLELDADPAGDFHSGQDDFAGQHGFDRAGFADDLRAAGFRDVSVGDGGSVEKELEGRGRRTFTMFLAIGYATAPGSSAIADESASD
jgi:ubiquinone/menaquinone biosynthesis C-methylase UbiE